MSEPTVASATEWRLHGHEQPQIVAAGHSHVASLLTSIQDDLVELEVPAAVGYSHDPRGAPPTDSGYWDYVVEISIGKVLVIVWNGNQHNAGFLIAPDPPIRLHSDRPDADPPNYGVWVPRHMLRSHWDPTLDGLSELLGRLSADTSALVLGTPAPKRESTIRSNLAGEVLFKARANQAAINVDQLRLTSEDSRMTMWTVLQEMLAERAERAGAVFLPVPDSATDDDGFLLEEYSFPDATHANSKYGALAWALVADHLAREAA